MTETKTTEKTELTKTGEATEEKPKLFNLTQIAGGALAAITTAALGSRLGYGGTLAGAGIASVLAAFAGTLYTKGLEHTREGVKKIVLRDSEGRPAVVSIPDEARDEDDRDTSAAPASGRRQGSRRPWIVFGGMLATAAVTFVVAMGIVTGWEFGTGQSLDGRNGTTIGQASNNKRAAPKPSASATTTKAAPSAAPSGNATATPSATPTPTATDNPTVAPTPDPTTAEATKAPADSVPEGSEG